MKPNSFFQAWCLVASLVGLSMASPVLDKRDAAPSSATQHSTSSASSASLAPTSTDSEAPVTTHQTTSSSSLPVMSPTPITSPLISGGRETPNPTLSIARAAMTPYLYGCTSQQKATVQQAWAEANTLAQAGKQWTPPGWFTGSRWQAAMNMYMGTDSSDDNGWFGSTGELKQNTLRQSGIHETDEDWSPYWSYTYMYCDESQVPRKPKAPPIGECGNPRNPGKKVTAYTFPDDGSIFGWNAKYVVLCPRFFDSDILTLAEMTANAKANTSLAQIMDPWRKVKARIMFHETYHWSPEVSIPAAVATPEVYVPWDVVQLAKTSNVPRTKLNAESWTQAALAIYLQQTFNLKNPPSPLPAALAASSLADDLEELWLSAPPDGFAPPVPVTASSFDPSLTNVTIIGSSPSDPSATGGTGGATSASGTAGATASTSSGASDPAATGGAGGATSASGSAGASGPTTSSTAA